MSNELAIVIPAYKAKYLDSALASIAAQTDRDFSVFVGDDASPDDLAAICDAWRDRLPIRYHRFEQNLGRDNLVAQWTRCIRETREPWVWLFGDDDEMGPGCVQAWRAFQAGHPDVDLFHFEADRIDENGRNMGRAPPWPARMSSRQFALARLRFDIDSYAPDYIFRRSAWERVGGFQPFPLAWCSDDATWIKIAALNGVHTVPGSRVRWRMSGINISSAATVRSGDKTRACLLYLEWLRSALESIRPADADPPVQSLMTAGRWWFLQHAQFNKHRFGWRESVAFAWKLSRLGYGGFVGTLLRIFRFELRSALR